MSACFNLGPLYVLCIHLIKRDPFSDVVLLIKSA